MTSTPALSALAPLATTPSPAAGAARAAASPDRLAAAGMALAAVLSIVFVALDPEVRVRGARAVLEAIAANASIHQSVHVPQTLFMLVLAHGVAGLAARLGLTRPAVRFGLLA